MPAEAVTDRSWVSGNSRSRALQGRENCRIPCHRRIRRGAIAAAAALFLGNGCGDKPRSVPEAQPYVDPGFVEAGPHRMYYALTLARDLPSAIAGSYGIEQRRNLAVLTIRILPAEGPAAAGLPAASVEAEAISLIGARQQLALSRHDEPGGATWLATVEVIHRVPLSIEIRARATSDGPLLRARLTREFRLD